jgi:hypothetical protein
MQHECDTSCPTAQLPCAGPNPAAVMAMIATVVMSERRRMSVNLTIDSDS